MQPHRILLLDNPRFSSGEIPCSLLRDLVSDFEASNFAEGRLADGSAIQKPASRYKHPEGLMLALTSPDAVHRNSHDP